MDASAPTVDVPMLQEEAALWGFLHDLFRPPTEEQWNWLDSEPAQAAWRLLSNSIGGELPLELPRPDSPALFEEEYLSAFEVGVPHPPCPLIESHWNRSENVPKVLHENTLFYRSFGLAMKETTLETADHLRFQLDFMRHLCRLYAGALEQDNEEQAAQLRQAHADYLERHLGWTCGAAQTCRGHLAGWPAEWMDLLASVATSLCRHSLWRRRGC